MLIQGEVGFDQVGGSLGKAVHRIELQLTADDAEIYVRIVQRAGVDGGADAGFQADNQSVAVFRQLPHQGFALGGIRAFHRVEGDAVFFFADLQPGVGGIIKAFVPKSALLHNQRNAGVLRPFRLNRQHGASQQHYKEYSDQFLHCSFLLTR